MNNLQQDVARLCGDDQKALRSSHSQDSPKAAGAAGAHTMATPVTTTAMAAMTLRLKVLPSQKASTNATNGMFRSFEICAAKRSPHSSMAGPSLPPPPPPPPPPCPEADSPAQPSPSVCDDAEVRRVRACFLRRDATGSAAADEHLVDADLVEQQRQVQRHDGGVGRAHEQQQVCICSVPLPCQVTTLLAAPSPANHQFANHQFANDRALPPPPPLHHHTTTTACRRSHQ